MIGRLALVVVLFLAGVGVCVLERKAVPEKAAIECRRVKGAMRLDGALDEDAWTHAVPLADFRSHWNQKKAATQTTARLLWDDDHLYFGAEMEDQDLFALTTERNGMTWEDDVFELFFKPAKDKPAYYEFQVNAKNTHLELYLPSRGAGGYRRFGPLTKKLGMESVVALQGTLNNYEDTDKSWTVEGRLPWSAFAATGGKPKVGDRWLFTLCRYDYSVKLENTNLTATAPLTHADFHRYEDYADLLFVAGEKEEE